LIEVDVQEIVRLLPDCFILQFTGGADEASRRDLEVVVKQSIANAGNGNEEHHPDQQNHDGQFDQRIAPVIHFPSC
jgi:hypothetical protein